MSIRVVKRLPLLVCLALASAVAAQDQKAKRKIAWLLPKSRVAEYGYLGAGGKPVADRSLWVFGSELRGDGSNRIEVDRYADIPIALLFTLPDREVKPGDVWEYQRYFFHAARWGESGEGTGPIGGGWWGSGPGGGPSSLPPVCAKGQFRLVKYEKDKKTDEECALIAGQFNLFEMRQERPNNERKLVITKNDLGDVSVTASVGITRGVLVRGAWAMKSRSWERQVTKEESKIAASRTTTSETIEIREEVDLDAEKMTKAIEAQVKKAVEWLRKQQQAGGDWATIPALEDGRVRASIAGLCVRALLAAGAKPDDPAVDRAMRWLKSQPAGTPASTCGQATAFVYRAAPNDKPFAELDLAKARGDLRKAIPKGDLEVVRSFVNGLLSRRDAKNATWGTDKDYTNILTTRHAIEALALAAEAGIDSPVDAWSRLLDLLTATMTEEGAVVELAWEGVTFPEPDTDTNRKVKPASWRFDIADPDGRASGNAFTTCAAAELLKACEIELTRRGALKDAQKRALDRAQRGALAWIQSRRSWRTPVPSEADYSAHVFQHAHAVMRACAVYGAKKVDGVDWHLEGAYHLMRQQYEDGHWDCGYAQPAADTAHAILFLTRAVLRPSPEK